MFDGTAKDLWIPGWKTGLIGRIRDKLADENNMEFPVVSPVAKWGFVVEQGDRLAPTRAAILVFGRARHVRRILPRPVVDCQFIDSPFHSWSTDRRWYDRIVVEENLVQAWLMLSERYAKHSEHPFSRGLGNAPAG